MTLDEYATCVVNTVYSKTKETTMKNVLFLAPSYPYAGTVIENLHKELTRYGIPHTTSFKSDNMYVKTDDVKVEFVHMDPVKYTPDLFMNRDGIFGKKVLTEKVHKTYAKAAYPIANCSIGKYLRDAYEYSRTRGVTVFNTPDYKPRTAYLPEITNVYFNDPVTVVLWDDGTKTMVKCQEGDVYSPEIGLSLCITKKSLGNMPNFNNIFRKWCPEEEAETATVDATFADLGVGIKAVADTARDLKTSIMNGLNKFLEELK